jgi:hypothetical protein
MLNRTFVPRLPFVSLLIIIFSSIIFAQNPLRHPDSPTRPDSPQVPLVPCIVPVQILDDYAGLTAYSEVASPDGSSERAKHIAQQIAGSGITVTSAIFTGAPQAVGLFANGDCLGTTLTSPGIGGGAVLSTGNVRNVIDKVSGGPLIGPAGPQFIQYSQDSLISTANGTAGDAGLEAILAASEDGFPTYDASSLTIKFIPAMSYIEMYYVFASDEYNEFVGQINDIFAFFVNGRNVALLPDSTEPVAINTVNNGSRDLYAEPWSGYQNPQFYIDNSDHYFNTEMDGMTVVMRVEAQVIPNQENTIRLVVADTADDRGDSNVFIRNFSLKAIQRFTDSDGDGTPDPSDNCPAVFNPSQANSAGSGKAGDACRDTDGDSILDVAQDLNGDGVIDRPADKCPDFADSTNVCNAAPRPVPVAISFAALKGNGFVAGPDSPERPAHFNISAVVSKRSPEKLEVHLVYQNYDSAPDRVAQDGHEGSGHEKGDDGKAKNVKVNGRFSLKVDSKRPPQHDKVQIHIKTTTTQFAAADTFNGPGVRFTAPCSVRKNGKFSRRLNTCVVYALDSDGGEHRNAGSKTVPDRFQVVITAGPDAGYTSGAEVDLIKGDIRSVLRMD